MGYYNFCEIFGNKIRAAVVQKRIMGQRDSVLFVAHEDRFTLFKFKNNAIIFLVFKYCNLIYW